MARNNKNGGNVRVVNPKDYMAERRRSKTYWGERAKTRNQRMIDEAEATAAELKKGYDAAERLIEEEVRNIYKGFENAFGLSHAEAKRLITSAKSETPSKALIDAINRIADPDKRREMKALVSAPAYKWRIDRLDKIQKKATELSTRLYNAELRTDLRFLASQMDEAYKHTIFDIQHGTGGSGAFDILPESRIKQVLNTKWRGEHFSSRIWGNTQKLVTELRQNMLESFITGEGEREAAARIQERFGVADYEARRLIRTESTYVCGQAELEGYRNSAVERYEFASLDDDRRSKICERLDGKTFPISKAKPGVNYPPMHPFCRSSTLPVLPDEEDLDREWEDFQKEYVPDDLTFDEWLEGLEPTEDGKLVYTGKSGKSVDKSGGSGIIKGRSSGNGINSSEHYFEKVGEIDFNDQNAIDISMNDFEEMYKDSQIEHCRVITISGEVYDVHGGKWTVDTSILGEKMKGSINKHNHVKGESQYSFSYEDLKNSIEDGTSIAYAFDEKYHYSMVIPKMKFSENDIYSAYKKAEDSVYEDLFNAPEKIPVGDEQHERIRRTCIELGIEYSRTPIA